MLYYFSQPVSVNMEELSLKNNYRSHLDCSVLLAKTWIGFNALKYPLMMLGESPRRAFHFLNWIVAFCRFRR